MASSVATTTVVADAMSIACERASSARSAKKSMTKTTPAIRSSTVQIESGTMPAAPWMRSRRASSRSEVWSSHLSYADCALDVCGSASLTP